MTDRSTELGSIKGFVSSRPRTGPVPEVCRPGGDGQGWDDGGRESGTNGGSVESNRIEKWTEVPDRVVPLSSCSLP